MTEQVFPHWSEPLKRYDVNRMNLSLGAHVLASWLSDDVGSKRAAQAFVDRFERLDQISFGGYLGSGNSYHVRVAKGLIFIGNQFVDEQKVLIAVNCIVALLEDYMRFLDDATRGKNFPPQPLLVEFEMDGARAMEFYLSTGFPLGIARHS